jgi:hypothetical protein
MVLLVFLFIGNYWIINQEIVIVKIGKIYWESSSRLSDYNELM